MNKLLTIEQVRTVLNSIVENYLSDVEDNCDENGTIDWGGGVLGYESKEQLIEDILTYVKHS